MTQKNKEGSLECRFDPPLWIQRRAFATKFLLNNAVESVFDFGCGDGSLIQVLINSCRILKIAGVDLDPGEVYAAVDNCSPKARDFEEQRELPLNLQFYQGSIDTVDDRCKGWDAITMIEVIEHLPADVLVEFPKLLFGLYKPQFVIISTPNAEFNINFPNLNYGLPNATFRHWDHQFEWTREEFKSWSCKIAKLYNYTVSFDTVGQAICRTEPDVGGCTQFAIFTRSSLEDSCLIEPQNNTNYKLISVIDYPFFEEVDFSDSVIVDSIFGHCKEIFRKEALWKPEISGHGFQLDLKQLWDILEIRQKCKTFGKLQNVISSEVGARIFIPVDNHTIACDFDIANTRKEIPNSDVVEEIAHFKEMCINSTEGGFEGWGNPNLDDLKSENTTGW